MQEYLDMWINFANFRGRTTRRGFWTAVLFNILATMALGVVTGILAAIHLDGLGTLLYGIYALAVIVPSLAMGVRRLHDIGKSGVYYLFSFIPLVGVILVLVWFCQAGDPNPNAYGPPASGANGVAGF